MPIAPWRRHSQSMRHMDFVSFVTTGAHRVDNDQETTSTKRRTQLRAVAEAYFGALARKDFAAIPYDDKVVLRAPLVPGGVHKPLVGKEALRTVWWPPLVP